MYDYISSSTPSLRVYCSPQGDLHVQKCRQSHRSCCRSHHPFLFLLCQSRWHSGDRGRIRLMVRRSHDPKNRLACHRPPSAGSNSLDATDSGMPQLRSSVAQLQAGSLQGGGYSGFRQRTRLSLLRGHLNEFPKWMPVRLYWNGQHPQGIRLLRQDMAIP